MITSTQSKGITLAVTLLLCVTAFASNRGSLQVSTTFSLNGKQLAAGDYAVRWEGNGPDVQVSILKGSNVVATAPAHWIDLNTSAANDAAVIKKNDDGTNSLAEIRFGGKKKALAFDAATTQSMAR